MEVKILDSILHGALKPWKLDSTNTRRITELLKAANQSTPSTNAGLLLVLKTLLSDFPTLLSELNTQAPGNSSLLQHFYKINLPKYRDPVTQFYYSVITSESLRVFNSFLEQSENWTEPIDIRYQVAKILTSIRVLAQQSARELQERGFTSFPDTQSDVVHYSLFILKQMLTVLFFEIQERFASKLKESTSEDFFYLHYLQESYPEIPPIKPATPWFEYHFHSIQATSEFSKDAAIHLLSQIQQHQPDQFQLLQAAFENLIFLRSQNTDSEPQTIDQLTSLTTIKALIEKNKKSLLTQVNRLQFGQQRLEAVNKLLDELDYIQYPTPNKLSAPQMLYKYLQEQKEIYTQRFTEKFPVILDDEAPGPLQDEKPQKFSFGFHGDPAKLKTVVFQLCNQVELLNEQKNTSVELLVILTSKDLQPDSTQIYIGCETVQFRYILDRFSSYFNNLTPTTIERSGLFFTKKLKPYKAQNLYSNKIENPKDYLTIDNIIKQLQ